MALSSSCSSSSSTCCLLVLFLVLACDVQAQPTKVFNVKEFGAVGDGKTDSSKAFSSAFTSACQYNGHSQVMVPKGTFLVGSAVFKGPCKGPIGFNLEGTVKAPAGQVGKDSWITFQYIDQLTLDGGGTFDGQGETAWRHNDCQKNSSCQSLPVSIRFDFVTNSVVRGFTSLNSKNFHINVFGCKNVKFDELRIVAPADSPNTDGIHLGQSESILISDSVITTGDDCISIGPGTKNMDVLRVECGPGHGISIGSLGKYENELDVSGIRVKSCNLSGTDNGLRIKTWATSLKSKVYNISYEDVTVKDIYNPIFIDQQYCPAGNCDNTKASSVQIQDVWFENIHGTSKSQAAVQLKCSSKYPCKNVNFKDINLSYKGPDGAVANATCSNVSGTASGTQIPKLSACVE